MSDHLTQTTVHYGDTKVIRWDIEDSAEAVDNLRKAIERETGEHAHVRQDVIYSTNDIKQYVNTHFFDRDTMRAFNSRLGRERLVNGVLYFVTSEKQPDYYDYNTGEHFTYPRLYTLRKFEAGEFYTVGGFQAYTSSRQANKALDAVA